MSRTMRRTNKDGKSGKWVFEGDILNRRTYNNKVVFSQYCCVLAELVVVSKEEAYVEDAKYHSDAYFSMRNSPKWYRQILNKKLRIGQKQYLTKCSAQEEFDDYAEPRFVKDASWYW